jgi:hypothetical protein
MPKPVLVLRVVVASPGDVKAERDSLAEIFEEVNRDTARPAELHLELARWETDARPGFHPGGPQALIDPILDIEDCDLLIGIFWSRMGTPIPSGETGTEHEFQTAYTSWTKKQRPDILVYFCERTPQPQSADDQFQIERVQRFKTNFPRSGFSWKYTEVQDFKTLVARHLRIYLQDQIRTIWSKDAVSVREMQRARAKEPPTIAILGRISSSDPHDKPVVNADGCKQGLYQIGNELARAGCRIMVYDSRAEYAATGIVDGYVKSGAAQLESIRIRRPLQLLQEAFPGQSADPGVFVEEPIEKEQWEVAFIPSISESDGVVMAGNGQFTLLGGLQAVGARLPMIALAGFGGITTDVWEVLKGQRTRFANDKEIALMAGRDPGSKWAAACVEALLAQRKRRDALQIWRA